MSSRTWIYISILVVVLAAGGVFFWWMYKTSKITPKAEVTPTPTPQTFADVGPTYWAFTQIEAVNKAGYMVGYHEFKPDENATRADVAAAIGKAYSKSYNNPTPSFSDVPTTHWAYQYIEGLKQAGWLEGYPDGTFKPDQAATRSDLAVFIASAVAGGKANVPDPGNNVESPYSDVATTDAAFKFIYYAYQHDLMSGYPDGTFKPDQNATRADVAAAVARAKAGGDAAVPTPTTKTFTDVATDYWAYKYIEYCYSIGAISGYPPVFKPDDFADRASVAVGIARADAGSDAAVPAGPATPTFVDVPTSHWAYKYIEYVKSKGYMVGYDATHFQPDEIAYRYTIAVALARAKGLALDPAPATPTFADVATTDSYYKEVEAIYQAGYTQGCGTDPATGKLKFCPNDNLSRAALAVFLYNAYIKVAGVSPSPQPSTPTPAPSISVTSTPTPTPTAMVTTTPTPTSGAGAGTGTPAAKTGPEIPLAGGGVLGLLILARYLIGKRIR
jgi:hypothetical protein